MERKLATVLFADLVSSTEFVAGQDPEVARRRVTTFFDGVARCIETHGGTVEKFAGDAVMAAFGIPLAHEDDAERAVRAGLGILEFVRDRRPHVFTVYGEPGVGKSRLIREFLAGVEGTTILSGRALPYGEGITYWPLAEMVKSAAGITDDDPMETAKQKLIECCGDEAIAELLGLASGVMEAVEGERGAPEIAWAAREFADELADVQPLVMVFEDIHWAEEPLLELIDHLAQWVRERALLILCLARPELLDVRPGWGGGRVRTTAIELEPLGREDSEALADALLEEHRVTGKVRARLLDKTEGNPLFVEETVRMLVEEGAEGGDRIPDSLQAMIGARIDRLPAGAKILLQRGSVIGRTFWAGAIDHLSPEYDSDELEDILDDLLLRDFVTREERSTITGESAYRFKHVLIREVAYGGLSTCGRSEDLTPFAGRLREQADQGRPDMRAHPLGPP